MITLFTDSAAYIPMDMIIENDIQVLQHTLIVEGKELKENKIQYDEFYANIDKTQTLPQTKPLSAEEMYPIFENEIKQGNEVLIVLISSKFSDSYSNTVEATKMVKDRYSDAVIQVVDSKTSCMEQGFAVLAAAKKIRENVPFAEVVNTARDTIINTRALFIPQKLKYLEIDGRITKAQAIMGDMVRMAPILKSHNGSIVLGENNISRNRAITKSLEMLKDDNDKFGVKSVVVQHIGDFNEANKVVQKVKKVTDADVLISEIGPVFGARLGPGTISLTYLTERPITA